MPIQVGDIICVNDQKYIIIDIVDNKFMCIHLNDKVNFRKIAQINIDNFYDLDYEKTHIIENNEDVKYINSISDNTLKYILKMQKKYIESPKEALKIQSGSIVLKDNKYYYLYGEEGQNWLAFQIYVTKQNNLEELVLKNKKYYTNYADEKINKNELLKNIYVCNEKEKDMVKQFRKNYKLDNISKIKKECLESKQKIEQPKSTIDNNQIDINSIVKINEFSDEMFIVIDMLGDMLVCISCVESGLVNPMKHYFNKNSVILVKNKPKRK